MTVLHPGVQAPVLSGSPTQAGSRYADFVIQSDSVLVTLYVSYLAPTATVDVEVVGLTGGQESPLFSFPQITGATANVLLRRSSVAPQNIRVRISHSGPCTYEVQARAVFSGASDVRILGNSGFRVSQTTVGTSPTLIVPASIEDRAGLVVKNWSSLQTVYIAETLAKATSSIGYPLAPRDALALDLAAGVEVYAVSDAAGADLRIGEAGAG